MLREESHWIEQYLGADICHVAKPVGSFCTMSPSLRREATKEDPRLCGFQIGDRVRLKCQLFSEPLWQGSGGITKKGLKPLCTPEELSKASLLKDVLRLHHAKLSTTHQLFQLYVFGFSSVSVAFDSLMLRTSS